MRKGIRLLAAAFAVLAGACGDGGTGPDEEELTGTWRATKMEYVSVANSSQKVDVVALGATVTLVLDSDGTYTLTTAVPGQGQEILSGTWSASTDVLTCQWSGQYSGEMQFEMSLSGDTLTLSGAHTDFDINGDDVDEEARLNMVLARQ